MSRWFFNVVLSDYGVRMVVILIHVNIADDADINLPPGYFRASIYSVFSLVKCPSACMR